MACRSRRSLGRVDVHVNDVLIASALTGTRGLERGDTNERLVRALNPVVVQGLCDGRRVFVIRRVVVQVDTRHSPRR